MDLHIHSNAWSLHAGLSTADVFAAAITIDTGAGEIWVPCVTHMLLLSASHAARDLFGPSTAKSLVDSAGLLVRQGDQVNWPEFEARMTTARMGGPVRAYLGLLDSLGADTGMVPGHLKMRSGSREFGRALGDYIALFPGDLSVLAPARREWLLCAEPAVALGRNFQRLKGLLGFGRR